LRILVARLAQASGIATYTRWLVEGLAAAGNEVTLLDEGAAFEPSDQRIRVVGFTASERLPRALEPFRGWRAERVVARCAEELAADAIHVTNLSLAPRIERLVITAWDPIASPLGRLRAASARGEPRGQEAAHAIVDAIAARRASAIVAVTEAVKDGLSRFDRRTEVIPCFLPDDLITAPLPERSHEVVMVGLAIDSPRKGLTVAVEAVERARETVPEARLVLIGQWVDPTGQASLPDFCDVRGRMEPSDLRDVLRQAGCVLIASRWEEFGYAGLEALAAGAPVVCGPLPAYDGMSGGGVHVARDRSPAALAEQIVAAFECDRFEFPAECRASVAIPRLLDLYRAVQGGTTSFFR
jgi:glycosyltransferase involved in cell wall biosynthesis